MFFETKTLGDENLLPNTKRVFTDAYVSLVDRRAMMFRVFCLFVFGGREGGFQGIFFAVILFERHIFGIQVELCVLKPR